MKKRLADEYSDEDFVRWAWETGDLSWLFHSGQVEIWSLFDRWKAALSAFEIGRQWGKSFGTVGKFDAECRKNDGYVATLGTDTQDHIVRLVRPAFRKWLSTCPEDLRPVPKNDETRWIYPNKSELWLVGIDLYPDRMRGDANDLIGFDEVGHVKGDVRYMVKEVAMSTTLHTEGRVVLIGTTCKTPGHPSRELLSECIAAGHYIKKSTKSNPLMSPGKYLRLVRAISAMPRGTVEECEKDIRVRRELFCDWITDPALSIFPEWTEERARKLVERRAWPQFFDGYVVVDPGGDERNHFAVQFWAYDFVAAVRYLVGEIVLIRPTTREAAQAIRAKEAELFSEAQDVHRYSDTDLRLIQDLTFEYDMPFVSVPKGPNTLMPGVNAVRDALTQESIRVDPSCEKSIDQFRCGIWHMTASGAREFAHIDGFGHFDLVACTVYAVRVIDTTHNPRPEAFGLNIQTMQAPAPPDADDPPMKENSNTVNEVAWREFEMTH